MLSALRTVAIFIAATLPAAGATSAVGSSPRQDTNKTTPPPASARDSHSKPSPGKTKKASSAAAQGSAPAATAQKPAASATGQGSANGNSRSSQPAKEGDKLTDERLSTRGLHPPDEKPAQKNNKKDDKKTQPAPKPSPQESK
jgi:hypothetical protein